MSRCETNIIFSLVRQPDYKPVRDWVVREFRQILLLLTLCGKHRSGKKSRLLHVVPRLMHRKGG
jgi:hypothetical protein